MKKSLTALLFVSVLSGCLAPEVSIYPDEFNNAYNTSNSQIKRNLPELPNRAVFSTFNNAYKGLALENEEIARNDPYNADKYFFKVISSAERTLDVAFFDIYEESSVEYFIEAKKRGVEVRVITDTDNLNDKEQPGTFNRQVQKMLDAGITVKDDKRSAFMHHKFMIVDNKYVWLGSMNPTLNSLYHHNNNSLLIRSSQMVENYNSVFIKLFERNDFSTPINNIPNPVVDVDGAQIKTYFSPRGGAREAIVEELAKAKKSIRFMAFAFTEKTIGDVMIQKKKEGVKVEGVFDTCLLGKYSMYQPLRDNKVFVLRDGNQALLHHKTIIIDNETVITGSYNFSKSAEDSNNEDILIIKSVGLASKYNEEFFKVKNAALNNKDLPPYDHPACGGNGDPNGVGYESVRE